LPARAPLLHGRHIIIDHRANSATVGNRHTTRLGQDVDEEVFVTFNGTVLQRLRCNVGAKLSSLDHLRIVKRPNIDVPINIVTAVPFCPPHRKYTS
jgi:hypothetical protein